MMGSTGGVSGTPAFQQMQALRTQVFNRSDADGSGALSVDEFKSMIEGAPDGKGPPGVEDPEAFFKTADADGNGELTQAELDSAFETQMKSFQSTVSRFGEGMPPPPPGDSGREDDDSTSGVQQLSTGDLLKALLSRLQALSEGDGSTAATRAGLSVQA